MPQPHALTSLGVTDNETYENAYEYDANGNALALAGSARGAGVTCRNENNNWYTQGYNAENRISSVIRRGGSCKGTILESWTFAYDGDGVRTTTAHFVGLNGTPDTFTSYYFGGAYETRMDGTTIRYYSFNGQTIAMDNGAGLKYFLTDHPSTTLRTSLGSVVAVTDSAGILIIQQRYLLFGGHL